MNGKTYTDVLREMFAQVRGTKNKKAPDVSLKIATKRPRGRRAKTQNRRTIMSSYQKLLAKFVAAQAKADQLVAFIDRLDHASDRPTFDKSLYGVQSKLGIGTVGKNTIVKMEKSKGAKKYTLQEIYDNKIAVHCDTEEKANKLLKAFDKMGWGWSSGLRYTDINRWGRYREKTCYHPTIGVRSFGDTEWYADEGYTIIEFADVDLGD